MIKKDKKLQRDKKAFEEGRAYKWHSDSNYGRSQSKRGRNGYNTNNNSDLSIYPQAISFSQSSSQQRGRGRQKPHKRGTGSCDDSSHIEASLSRTGNTDQSRSATSSDRSDTSASLNSSRSSIHLPTTSIMTRSQSVPPGTFLDQMRSHTQAHQKKPQPHPSKTHKSNKQKRC